MSNNAEQLRRLREQRTGNGPGKPPSLLENDDFLPNKKDATPPIPSSSRQNEQYAYAYDELLHVSEEQQDRSIKGSAIYRDGEWHSGLEVLSLDDDIDTASSFDNAIDLE